MFPFQSSIIGKIVFSSESEAENVLSFSRAEGLRGVNTGYVQVELPK